MCDREVPGNMFTHCTLSDYDETEKRPNFTMSIKGYKFTMSRTEVSQREQCLS